MGWKKDCVFVLILLGFHETNAYLTCNKAIEKLKGF
jgi:hypothetical protein